MATNLNLKDKIYFEEPIRDRFYNGYSENEQVVLKYDNKVGSVTIRNLFKLVKPAERLVAKGEDIWLKDIYEDMQVLGRNGFERLVEVVRRKTYEPLVVIETQVGKTTVGASHKLPVKRGSEELLLRADEIKEGDEVYVIEEDNTKGRYERITKIYPDEKEHLSVYGLVTESGGAIVSGVFQKSY